jgi:hypothetical protein
MLFMVWLPLIILSGLWCLAVESLMPARKLAQNGKSSDLMY